MSTGKAIYLKLALARESTTWVLTENQRQPEEWESFMVEKKKKKHKVLCSLIESHWHEEAVGRLIRSGLPYVFW